MVAARIDPLVRSFERFMRAERKSERTIDNYFEALEQFGALLEARGRGLAEATTADVQDYIIDIIERLRPATANNRFRALHRFYGWLEDEEEIPNPMRRLKPPPVPEEPVPVLDADALRRLFEVCQGRGFDERRDTAILSLFLDAGPRLEELTEIRAQDIDHNFDVIHVTGKGGRPRALPFGNKTGQALTAISAFARATPTRAWRRCGSASEARSPAVASPRSSAGAASRPVSRACIPTCSATPSPIAGAPTAATRPTSCALPAGTPPRCCAATPPPPPTPAPARPIDACPRSIGCSCPTSMGGTFWSLSPWVLAEDALTERTVFRIPDIVLEWSDWVPWLDVLCDARGDQGCCHTEQDAGRIRGSVRGRR